MNGRPRSGALDRLVSVMVPTTTTDEWGAETHAYAEAAVVPMAVEPERARERLRAGRMESVQAAMFTYRGPLTLQPSYRLVTSGETWEVVGWPVQIQRRPLWYEVVAERVG